MLIEEIPWCINNSDNMIGLPAFAHTIFWYMMQERAGVKLEELKEPSFSKLCQHTWDHNGGGRYTWEVDQALCQLTFDFEEAEHEVKPADISAELNHMSKEFRSKLDARGKRQGGTHQAWKDGRQGGTGRWFEPFSMAMTSYVTQKPFPITKFSDKVTAWIKRFEVAAWGG